MVKRGAMLSHVGSGRERISQKRVEILDQEKSHFSCRVPGFSVLWKETPGVTADLSTKGSDETQGSCLKFNSVIRATTGYCKTLKIIY